MDSFEECDIAFASCATLNARGVGVRSQAANTLPAKPPPVTQAVQIFILVYGNDTLASVSPIPVKVKLTDMATQRFQRS